MAVIDSMWRSPFSRDKRLISALRLSIESIFWLFKSETSIEYRLNLLKNFIATCSISNSAPVFSSKYSVILSTTKFCILLFDNKIKGVINKTSKVVITISVIFVEFFITLYFNLQR